MSEERNLPASPRRREQAERQGILPRSEDLGAASVLAAAAVSLGLVVGGAMRFALRVVSEGLTGASAVQDSLQAAMASWGTVLCVLAPFAFFLALAAVAANLAQTGWRPRPDAILPDLSRVAPWNGWKDFFGGGHRVAFSALKLASVTALVAWTVWEGREGWLAAASEGAAALAGWAGGTVGTFFVRCVVVLAFLGLLDHLALRARIERRIAVAPTEAAQEARDAEGDPALRRRRRAQHAERAAGGRFREGAWILADRARVAIVLAGPWVLAVAGAGMARSFLRAARLRGTRVVEDSRLARALAGRVRPGGRVPAELEPRLREAFSA